MYIFIKSNYLMWSSGFIAALAQMPEKGQFCYLGGFVLKWLMLLNLNVLLFFITEFKWPIVEPFSKHCKNHKSFHKSMVISSAVKTGVEGKSTLYWWIWDVECACAFLCGSVNVTTQEMCSNLCFCVVWL